jgi:ADP-sugar diphosphatase
VYSLLVEQARLPVGEVACLELPAGMLEGDCFKGTAVQEIQEECGITLQMSDLVDLTQDYGLAPSPGGCDEVVQYFYGEKRVTRDQLNSMRDRLTGLLDEGEAIILKVVPWDDMWKISRDTKVAV